MAAYEILILGAGVSGLWALIGEAGLETYEVDGSQLCFAGGRLEACGAANARGFAVLERMTEWAALNPHAADETFARYVDRAGVDPGAADSAARYVEGFNAADRHVIGIAGLASQQRAEDAIEAQRIFRLSAGYQAIPALLARQFQQEGGTLLLGRTVRRIAWQRGAVRLSGAVAGARFEIDAERAIVTLPLGVLQRQTVEFEPAPATRLAQAGRLAMGRAVRLTLRFSSAFWGERRLPTLVADTRAEAAALSFLFTPDEAWPTWRAAAQCAAA